MRLERERDGDCKPRRRLPMTRIPAVGVKAGTVGGWRSGRSCCGSEEEMMVTHEPLVRVGEAWDRLALPSLTFSCSPTCCQRPRLPQGPALLASLRLSDGDHSAVRQVPQPMQFQTKLTVLLLVAESELGFMQPTFALLQTLPSPLPLLLRVASKCSVHQRMVQVSGPAERLDSGLCHKALTRRGTVLLITEHRNWHKDSDFSISQTCNFLSSHTSLSARSAAVMLLADSCIGCNGQRHP